MARARDWDKNGMDGLEFCELPMDQTGQAKQKDHPGKSFHHVAWIPADLRASPCPVLPLTKRPRTLQPETSWMH